MYSLWTPAFPAPLHQAAVLRAALLRLVLQGIKVFMVGLLRAYNMQKLR